MSSNKAHSCLQGNFLFSFLLFLPTTIFSSSCLCFFFSFFRWFLILTLSGHNTLRKYFSSSSSFLGWCCCLLLLLIVIFLNIVIVNMASASSVANEKKRRNKKATEKKCEERLFLMWPVIRMTNRIIMSSKRGKKINEKRRGPLYTRALNLFFRFLLSCCSFCFNNFLLFDIRVELLSWYSVNVWIIKSRWTQCCQESVLYAVCCLFSFSFYYNFSFFHLSESRQEQNKKIV